MKLNDQVVEYNTVAIVALITETIFSWLFDFLYRPAK